MNIWKERFNLAMSSGGLKATFFWIAKKILRKEVHFIYTCKINSKNNHNKIKFHFITLHTKKDILEIHYETLKQLEKQSGMSIINLLKNNNSIYALLDENNVVSQINIYWGKHAKVDYPVNLTIHIKFDDVFVGYLFTSPHYRGRGCAKILMDMAKQDVFNFGYSRMIAHIRSTNVPSLKAFRKSGWQQSGWIITSTDGKLLTFRSTCKPELFVSKCLEI